MLFFRLGGKLQAQQAALQKAQKKRYMKRVGVFFAVIVHEAIQKTSKNCKPVLPRVGAYQNQHAWQEQAYAHTARLEESTDSSPDL